MERICYYTATKDETGADRLRFGLCRRTEAQIIVTYERWQRLSKRLADEGCRMVEVQERQDEPKGRASQGARGRIR